MSSLANCFLRGGAGLVSLGALFVLSGCPQFSGDDPEENNDANAMPNAAMNQTPNAAQNNNTAPNTGANVVSNNTAQNNNMASNNVMENMAPNNTSPNNNMAPNNNTAPNNTTPNNMAPNNNTAPNNTSQNNNTSPEFEVRSCVSVVEFDQAQGAGSVTLSGEFNGWDLTATPMTRDGGVWRAELELPAGDYAYKFVVDGAYEDNLPPEVPTKWSGDVENRNLRVHDCMRPDWRVESHEVSPDGMIRATLKFVSSAGEAQVDPASVKVTIADMEITPTIDAETGTITVEYAASAYGKYSIRAWASDVDGNETETSPLWLPLWHEEEPFEWQDATMYLIFTDRFLDSDSTMPVPPIEGVAPIAGYMGGDFKGIIDKIEEGYFDELGVNLLWLSPIYENTEEAWVGSDGFNMFTGFHGYWPIEPLLAESRYGDGTNSADDRLAELIDKAHERGIRVLFDVVHNHVHEDHLYCRENPSWCEITCTCGAQGCDWEGPNGKPLTCQFAPYLPDLSYRNHDILNRQIDDTVRLGEMFDIDGFRVDAAKHMDHIIMRTLRRRLGEIEEQGATPFYTVGETYTGGDGYGLIMNYVADYELHGQFDFPLLYPIRGTFGHDGSFRDLEAAVVRSEMAYGDAYMWMSPFLGNHDIPRFVTDSLGNDWNQWDSTIDVMAQGAPGEISPEQWNIINRMSMGFAFLLSQPGIPLIYYGDEVGLAGSGDPDNRRMMDWDWNAGQRELIGRVRALGQARQQLEPLRRGDRRELWVDDTLYVYARSTGPGETVIVAMNKGATRSEVVQVPAALGINNATLVSFSSDRTIQIGATAMTLELDPWEYVIYHVETP